MKFCGLAGNAATCNLSITPRSPAPEIRSQERAPAVHPTGMISQLSSELNEEVGKGVDCSGDELRKERTEKCQKYKYTLPTCMNRLQKLFWQS